MKWRPIHTAPKDEAILLCYLGADQKSFVCQGRWVDVPHDNELNSAIVNGRQLRPVSPHWEIAYVAIQNGYVNGDYTCRSYSPQSHRVSPTHWMPLPAPAKGAVKRWFTLKHD